MCRLLLVSFAVTAYIILVTRAHRILPVPISTRYITTSISTLSQGEEKTFIASLCGGHQLLYDTVNATVLLNNNPSWLPQKGVVYYYIVDDPNKTAKDALCNNTDETGETGPYCVVPKWNSTEDLYIKARAGEVDAISFSIYVVIGYNATNKEEDNVKDTNARQNHVVQLKPSYSRFHLNADIEYLTEIITMDTNQRLGYLDEALLEITFCPNPFTTLDYKITSTVFGTDGISSYAQYICEKLPCEVDNPNVVKFNGKQLPNNEVVLTTSSGQYQHIYVLIVCWAGQYDPSVGNYVGEFQYSASLKHKSP
ncbi:uncharacterized protein [Amphiura filiformis]|uniref:uncharacterized protein n=1 Tax=Amphiura filiformis TaxID=82378 RepID=UPI003B211C97